MILAVFQEFGRLNKSTNEERLVVGCMAIPSTSSDSWETGTDPPCESQFKAQGKKINK